MKRRAVIFPFDARTAKDIGINPVGLNPAANSLISQYGTVRIIRIEAGRCVAYPVRMTKRSRFRYFKTSPEIILLAVMMYI